MTTRSCARGCGPSSTCRPTSTWWGRPRDGEEAVAVAARAHGPDVILLDLVMPRLDGIGALRRLRETVPSARVIVLTSFGEDERALHGFTRGCERLPAQGRRARRARAARSGRPTRGAPSHPTWPPGSSRSSPAGRPTRRRPTLTPARARRPEPDRARAARTSVIALELGVAEKTVKTHVSHILGKLGLYRPHPGRAVRVRHGLRRNLRVRPLVRQLSRKGV